MGSEVVQKHKGTLFIVSTPIGNLSDITFRAVEILKNVDMIACEDTRNTSVLCEKYNIKTRLTSYHKFSESEKSEYIIRNLDEGKNIALVSDAGTPLISDPGVKLVTDARLRGHNVVPIVGASAVLALIASIPRHGEDFKFLGFLPRVRKQIENLLKSMIGENLVFYESSNRLIATLSVIADVRKGAKIAIGRELTKKFEEIKVDSVENLISYYNTNVLKGEIVCMLYAMDEKYTEEFELKNKILKLKRLNFTDKDIASVINTLYGTAKNDIKAICLELQNEQN